jgi:hypothetical protein
MLHECKKNRIFNLSAFEYFFRLKLLSIWGTLWWHCWRRWWVRWRARSWRTHRQIFRIRINRWHTLSRHNRRCSRRNWGCGRCQSWRRCRDRTHVWQTHFSFSKVHVVIVQLIVQLIMEFVHFVVLSQMLSNLCVTVLVVRYDDVARICRRYTRFTVVLSR